MSRAKLEARVKETETESNIQKEESQSFGSREEVEMQSRGLQRGRLVMGPGQHSHPSQSPRGIQ